MIQSPQEPGGDEMSKIYNTIYLPDSFWGVPFKVGLTWSEKKYFYNHWYINASGEMYDLDWTDTYDLDIIEDEEKDYSIKLTRNGNRGRVRVFDYTGIIHVYPKKYRTPIGLRLNIKNGKVVSYRRSIFGF